MSDKCTKWDTGQVWRIIDGNWSQVSETIWKHHLLFLQTMFSWPNRQYPNSLSNRLNRSFVEFHFDTHAYILFQMPESLCGYWSCLRDEVIQLTLRAQPHCADTRSRDSQARKVDWSVLMCFLERAHFLTSIGLCYGDSRSWMFLPPFPLHGIKCPNRLHITALCLCRQHWCLSATEKKPKLF